MSREKTISSDRQRRKSVLLSAPRVNANGADLKHETLMRQRRLFASFCQMLGEQMTGVRQVTAPPVPSAEDRATRERVKQLSPRVQETLKHLLAGDSEKQIAARLQLSKHTIHVYVKMLYRNLGASSRGELLAQFVDKKLNFPINNPPPATRDEAQTV